ncbi:unnamed protein product [Gordionus sp. m RMFG-2023]
MNSSLNIGFLILLICCLAKPLECRLVEELNFKIILKRERSSDTINGNVRNDCPDKKSVCPGKTTCCELSDPPAHRNLTSLLRAAKAIDLYGFMSRTDRVRTMENTLELYASSFESYGCCPYENGVCCQDHLHCCPGSYLCNMKEQKCDKQDVNRDIYIMNLNNII